MMLKPLKSRDPGFELGKPTSFLIGLLIYTGFHFYQVLMDTELPHRPIRAAGEAEVFKASIYIR